MSKTQNHNDREIDKRKNGQMLLKSVGGFNKVMFQMVSINQFQMNGFNKVVFQMNDFNKVVFQMVSIK